jgi:hypothetical protein
MQLKRENYRNHSRSYPPNTAQIPLAGRDDNKDDDESAPVGNSDEENDEEGEENQVVVLAEEGSDDEEEGKEEDGIDDLANQLEAVDIDKPTSTMKFFMPVLPYT